MRMVAVALAVALSGSGFVWSLDPPPPTSAPVRLQSAEERMEHDMEALSPPINKGVTPRRERLSPSLESGGPGVLHRAGEILPATAAGSGRMFRSGFQAGEPTLGVAKDGTIIFQALDNGPTVISTKDGGRTWEDVSPAIAGHKRHAETLDPFLWVDPDTDRIFTYDFFFGCSLLSFSDDVGKSWTTATLNCGLMDHQNLFAGPPVSSPTVGYPNVVYSCSSQAGATIYSVAAQCLKSIDGGLTWVPSGEPAFVTNQQPENDLGLEGYCHGAIGHGHVGRDGTVFVPKAFCGEPWLAISHDEGATWERVQVADNGVPQTSIGVYEHEASVATDAKGNVYYFWIGGDRLPYLSVSSDGGESWSPPMMVGPPALAEATLPHLTVGGVGKVAVVYYGSTNSPGPPFPQKDDCREQLAECFGNLFFLNPPDPKRYGPVTWNGYMTVSDDALSSRPTFLSVTVNDPDDPFVRGTCGPIRCKGVYDFIDVVIDRRGRPWAAYVDVCILACAEEGTANQGNEGVLGTIVGGPVLTDSK